MMYVIYVCAQDINPLPGPSWRIIDCSVVLASFMCREMSDQTESRRAGD